MVIQSTLRGRRRPGDVAAWLIDRHDPRSKPPPGLVIFLFADVDLGVVSAGLIAAWCASEDGSR
jgi:hypothetical protein